MKLCDAQSEYQARSRASPACTGPQRRRPRIESIVPVERDSGEKVQTLMRGFQSAAVADRRQAEAAGVELFIPAPDQV
jgi:hypothetical protein